MTALSLAIQMAIFMCIGFFAKKGRIVDDRFSASLAAFIFNFVFPCSVIHSMQVDYDPAQVLNGGVLILVSLITMVVMLGLGILTNRITRKSDDMSRILIVNLMFTNFTYMAFPIMETLYGSLGSFYIAVYTIPVRILFYVATPLIFTLGKDEKEGVSAKRIRRDVVRALLSPPVVAVPVGLVIYIFGISIPGPISGVIESLSRVAAPMGMVLCGVTMAAIPLSKILRENRVFLIAALRLLVAPAIMLGIYFVVTLWIPIDPVIAKVSILYCALPVAATTTILAIKAQSDATRAAQCVFVTTLISIVTLPMWAEILNRLIDVAR